MGAQRRSHSPDRCPRAWYSAPASAHSSNSAWSSVWIAVFAATPASLPPELNRPAGRRDAIHRVDQTRLGGPWISPARITPELSASELPPLLPPPRRRSFRFRQGAVTISTRQGRDAPGDMVSGLMHPFRSEFAASVSIISWVLPSARSFFRKPPVPTRPTLSQNRSGGAKTRITSDVRNHLPAKTPLLTRECA